MSPNPMPIAALETEPGGFFADPCNGLHSEWALAEHYTDCCEAAIRRAVKGVDDWYAQEDSILTALLDAMSEANRGIADRFAKVLPTDSNDFDWARFYDTADEAAEDISKSLARNSTLRRRLLASVSVLIGVGGVAGSGPGQDNVVSDVRQQVINGIVRSASHYANTFFQKQVVPSIVLQITNVLDGVTPMGSVDLSVIRRVLDDRLKSVPYWRVVANASASRGYHYGLTKAALHQGFRRFRYSATVDDRTSEICTYFNGREFMLADAAQQYEQASLADAEDVKTIHPWFSPPSKGSGETFEQAAEAYTDGAVPLPPLHGNCRSTITPV